MTINLAELECSSGLLPKRFARAIRSLRLQGYLRRVTPLPELPAQILEMRPGRKTEE
ncbi:hypothetical protein ACTJKT_01395 [Pseudomonas sp. 22526]|uniref:hypothetical protein n=1 Tax=Pseudomonas sp. 22526 TaxID=3453937 RepID=UPI003F8349DF